MKAVLGLLGRTGCLYLVLCLAIAFSLLVLPRITGDISAESLRQDTMSAAQIAEQVAKERTSLQSELQRREAAIRNASLNALDKRLRSLRERRFSLQSDLREDVGLLDSVRPSRMLERQKDQLRLKALDIEIDALIKARDARLADSAVSAAGRRLQRYARIPTASAVAVSKRLCREAQSDLNRFDALNPVEQAARDLALRQRQNLSGARDTRCEAARQREQRRAQGLAARQAYDEAQRRYDRARSWALQTLPQPAQMPERRLIRDVLILAGWALLGILLLPFAIRTVLYYVVAPIAERRRAIGLSIPGIETASQTLPIPESKASQAIELGPDEEMLVRQGFLQSSPARADMRTQFLLDWSSPFASLASGMALLTRVRGDGTTSVISTDDDPFAEVAVLTLAEGSSLVLQPRALAAVVQPRDKPLRIISRWRLFSFNAWLTQQLRFLVFHGPARLVLKGSRGVRVEAVDAGRRFGQDQLVGFSADLAYRVTRNETFVPYLLGREPLLRDRVEGGTGILVLEEAPRAGRRKGARGALEGMFDAALKAFGI